MTAPALQHPHRPTIGRAYTVRNSAGDKLTRVPEAIFLHHGGLLIRYVIRRGEVRCCSLHQWQVWLTRSIMICKCGHDRSAHVETLFGMKCNGRDWHDLGSFECHCSAFVPARFDCSWAGRGPLGRGVKMLVLLGKML